MKTIALAALTALSLAPSASAAVFSFNGTGLGAIPDATVDFTFGVPLLVNFAVTGLDGPIVNVTLSINMSHSWIGDLEVDLSSNEAVNFLIFGRVGTINVNQNEPAGNSGSSADLLGTYVSTTVLRATYGGHRRPPATTERTGCLPPVPLIAQKPASM